MHVTYVCSDGIINTIIENLVRIIVKIYCFTRREDVTGLNLTMQPIKAAMLQRRVSMRPRKVPII